MTLTKICCLFLVSTCSLLTIDVLRCGLSDPALSVSVRIFQAPIVIIIIFVFFVRVQPLRRSPAIRGLPARGRRQQLLRAAFLAPFPHSKMMSSVVRKRSAQPLSGLSSPTYCMVSEKISYNRAECVDLQLQLSVCPTHAVSSLI